MLRKSRIVIGGYPHHIIQRGHNRQVVFASDDDYLYYLDNLREWKEKIGGCPRTRIFVILGNAGAIISMVYKCKFPEKAILGQPPRLPGLCVLLDDKSYSPDH
ncbi:MAG: hypothetical protein Q7J06_04895 [Bacteroidales bacterium]|nr:hypothetical protein [Bacteroidales bacterium]